MRDLFLLFFSIANKKVYLKCIQICLRDNISALIHSLNQGQCIENKKTDILDHNHLLLIYYMLVIKKKSAGGILMNKDDSSHQGAQDFTGGMRQVSD